jgi:hypothetical protein
MQVQKFNRCLQTKKGHFFSIGIIYSDLNKEQKGLINNYYSVQINLVIYFIYLKTVYK